MTHSIDELELELRRIPGVDAAGFESDDDVLVVHLDMIRSTETSAPKRAARIAARHSDRPVAVEIRRRRTHDATSPTGDAEIALDDNAPESEMPSFEPPVATDSLPRVRLLTVLSFPDTDEVEVHLLRGDQRTIGRDSASAGVAGVAAATISAVTEIRPDLRIELRWAREIDNDADATALVAVSVVVSSPASGPVHCCGVAASSGRVDAAARASLDALNRQLSRS